MKQLKYLLVVLLVLDFNAKSKAQSIAPAKVIHPEQIIFDYQPDDADIQNWFNIEGKEITELQKNFLIKKLKAENHKGRFADKSVYSSDKTDDWKKLETKVIHLFKNKRYGSKYLALIKIGYGENCYYSKNGIIQKSELLPIETDEYFVAPVTALESYKWPKGNIPKYDFKDNCIYGIAIQASKRPDHYGRRYLNGNLKYIDITKFSNRTLANLKAKLADEDLYHEVLEMGKLNNTLHETSYEGRIKLLINSDDWRTREQTVVYHLTDFTSEEGESYDLIYCPYLENFSNINMRHYTAALKSKDCYYFVKTGTIDDIGFGTDISSVLARILRKAPENYKGWEIPLRGIYEKLHGFCCFGSMTAGPLFGSALITDNKKGYFLFNGVLSTRDFAEKEFIKTINILDTISIVNYGKPVKDEFVPENQSKNGLITKKQLYTINANNKYYSASAMFIRFRDDFFLVGIIVLEIE